MQTNDIEYQLYRRAHGRPIRGRRHRSGRRRACWSGPEGNGPSPSTTKKSSARLGSGWLCRLSMYYYGDASLSPLPPPTSSPPPLSGLVPLPSSSPHPSRPLRSLFPPPLAFSPFLPLLFSCFFRFPLFPASSVAPPFLSLVAFPSFSDGTSAGCTTSVAMCWSALACRRSDHPPSSAPPSRQSLSSAGAPGSCPCSLFLFQVPIFRPPFFLPSSFFLGICLSFPGLRPLPSFRVARHDELFHETLGPQRTAHLLAAGWDPSVARSLFFPTAKYRRTIRLVVPVPARLTNRTPLAA